MGGEEYQVKRDKGVLAGLESCKIERSYDSIKYRFIGRRFGHPREKTRMQKEQTVQMKVSIIHRLQGRVEFVGR